MSFAGHVLDMMNRIKQNRELLYGKRNKKERLKSVMLINYHQKRYKTESLRVDISEEERAIILEKIKKDIERSERFFWIVRAPIVIFFIAFVVWAIWKTFLF